MIKFVKFLKVIFHLINFILIVLYLYPGSIFGYIFYNDFTKQPQITEDFLNISTNHFYAFVFLSIIGFLAYLNDKRLQFLIKYLFALSIMLELIHLIIPARMFQLSDLFGNVFGVLLIYVLYNIKKKYE
jgi:hypothetical protein